MKKLTTILLAAIVLAIAPIASMANIQQKGSPDQMIEKRVEHLKSNLGLDQAQVTKITAIFKQNESLLTNDRNAVKDAAKGSEAQKSAEQKMRVDMEQVHAQVMPILTSEQQAKWKEEIAKHESEHHGD
jgi:hypothetical protein